MINEDRLNTYGQDFDFDTHTVYVKMDGEVKDYKLTEKQFKELRQNVYFELTPEISLERLSDICEKLAADKKYSAWMAWSGVSYDHDEEKGKVTINIDLGDKISSHTISKEDFDVIKTTLEWDPGEKPLLPLEELDDKLGKFTAGEINIDSINVEPGFRMAANHIDKNDSLSICVDGLFYALDSTGYLMEPDLSYCRFDGEIVAVDDLGLEFDSTDVNVPIETSYEEELTVAEKKGHEILIDEKLDLGSLPYANRVAQGIVGVSRYQDAKIDDKLLDEAKECLLKTHNIIKYESYGKGDALDTFVSKMKEYSKTESDLAKAEYSAVLDMVSCDKFFIDDVKEVVRENSPFAIGEYGKARADFRVDNAVEDVNVMRRLRNERIAEFDLQNTSKGMNEDTLFVAVKKAGMEQGLGNVASDRQAVDVMFENKIPEEKIMKVVAANSSAFMFDKDGIKKMVGEVREERKVLAAKQAKAKEQLEKAKERQEEKNKAKQNQRQKQNEGLSGSGGNRKGENSGFSGGR